MSSSIAPISTVDSEAWSSSMPNSDLFTMSSVLEAATQETSPVMRERSPVIQRRGAALRSSPLGRFPAVTPTTMNTFSVTALPSLKHKLLPNLESDIPAPTEPSSSRNTIHRARASLHLQALRAPRVGRCRRSRSPAAEATPHQLLHHQASHRTLPRSGAAHHLRIPRHHPAASPRGPQTLVRTGSTSSQYTRTYTQQRQTCRPRHLHRLHTQFFSLREEASWWHVCFIDTRVGAAVYVVGSSAGGSDAGEVSARAVPCYDGRRAELSVPRWGDAGHHGGDEGGAGEGRS
ncbi:hypothetical protein DFH08DRAFT_437596 [Mycena albidolilacea]|uniref:Uncharacterized protein n=1 Tax=Mycena albidolilacea TaxID=1033008 RepID=A0AAD7AG38_9AGAR|nr:hypothetical protein DFH08DRAFT_437596 [Mycena albidolilacea]